MITAILGILVGMFTLITLTVGLVGLSVKWVLLPYLRTVLIDPVQETHRQVTVNQHASEFPTILDKMDDLKTQIESEAVDRKVQFAVLDEKLNAHLITHQWIRPSE